MPLYSYKCKKCNHIFDIQQPITEDPLKECPECNGEIFRMIGKNVGIQFVGSGFYINDTNSSKNAPKSSNND